MKKFSLGAAVMAVLASCAGDAELDTLNDLAGPEARNIDSFMDPIWYIALAVMILIFGLTAAIVVKFRVKEYEDGDWPEQVHGNTKLEIVWTAIPTVLMIAIAGLSMFLLRDLFSEEVNAVTLDLPNEGVSLEWEPHVVVVGQQWWWEYRYYIEPDKIAAFEAAVAADDVTQLALNLPEADIVTSGQIVIPVDQEVELTIMSRDVIHSHWIPSLNGKRDAAPGRVHEWKMESSFPGIFFGQCTEFCGLSHSRMRMQAHAMTETDFEAWLEEQMTPATPPAGAEAWLEAYRAGDSSTVETPTDSAEARGLVAFTQNCTSCHLVNGVNDLEYEGAEALVAGAAPDLTHLMSRTTFAGGLIPLYEDLAEGNEPQLNRNDLEAWLRNPADLKANYADGGRGMPALGLDDDTIDDLVAYLSTLGTPPSADAVLATQVD
ncbi:MAG: cytochrome c oxidase subunit II [Acidimicrobiales bacterium]|nr:cytochrome c oxidase subunit II [Acidimicrobiales bacterium]